MKKKVFLVSAIVAMAMSVMFVSCKEEVINGCTCTTSVPNEAPEVVNVSASDMKSEFGVTTCSALATNVRNRLEEMMKKEYGSDVVSEVMKRVDISCKKY